MTTRKLARPSIDPRLWELESAEARHARVRTDDALLMGYSESATRQIGFATVTNQPAGRQLIWYDGPHLMTCAPTGTGKGRCCAIPALLTYPGSVVCVDIKGELYATTSRRRREMGQQVFKLDPFELIDDHSDSLNPLDALSLPNAERDTDCQTLASLLAHGKRFTRDPFWDTSACGLISGCLSHISLLPEERERTLNKLRDLLNNDDVTFNLAVLLDTVGKKLPRMAYQEIASFLQQPERETRPSTLATAQAYLKTFNSDRVAKSLGPSTISLADFAAGKAMTIYVVIPPDRLESHSALLNLWFGTFLRAIFSRHRAPALRTLLLIDEAAQLGSFSMLQTAVTLCRTYGVRVWTFWQDLQQLQSCYPTGWKTLVNNTGCIQVFGMTNRQMAADWADIVDCKADDLLALAPDEQLLRLGRIVHRRTGRLDYLIDRDLKKLADENRFYSNNRAR